MKTLGQRRALLLRFRRFHSALTDSQRKTNREFLIYGANTDVGKTVVSAAVCRYGLTTGHPVTYIKPVQTGDDTDAGAVVKHAVQDAQNADLITETLFHYPSPESPASAAIKAGVTPPDATTFRGVVRESLQRAKERHGLCIVETAGGPLSPGPNHTFQADLYAPLTLPCILVGDSKLGGISTTVCAYEALKARGQQPHFILFLDTSPFAASNATALHRAVGNEVEVLTVPKALPPIEEPLQDWLKAAEVAEAISKMLGKDDQKIGGDEDLEAHLKMDQQHLWHPYTSMTKPTRVWPVRSADGCSLHLEDGRQLVDGMASWWCAIHGYNVPELNAAATKQLSKMSHVMFGGLTHRPATELAKLLVENSPEGLTQVFLCDSGSVSVEVAIKMSLQYWAMQGKTSKTRIATVQRGYHGDTFGAMSVCDPVRGMHTLFKETLAQQLFAEPPALCKDWNETLEDDGFSSMETLLKTHHASTAAVILEPVVQGAGGMRIYHPNYLRKLRQLCDDLDVLLIFDEIATGFGRTGKLFAAQHAQVVPDIMCIGKALTGGYCTLGAALATQRVGHGVSGDGTQPLMHGPTFMGNPLACSIASASIQLLLDSPWQKRVLNIQEQLRRELSPLASYPEVKDVRALGAIGVVELHQPPKEPQKLQAAFVEEGVWLRPFGQTIYTMPPFVISPEELGRISGAIATVLDAGIQLVE